MHFELHMFQVKERVRQRIVGLGIEPQYFMVRAEMCLKSKNCDDIHCRRFIVSFAFDKIVLVRLLVFFKKNDFCEF